MPVDDIATIGNPNGVWGEPATVTGKILDPRTQQSAGSYAPLTTTLNQLWTPQGMTAAVPGNRNFVPYSGNPIYGATGSGLTSIYWPWVLNVRGVISNPIDTYYMWYSTDHDTGPGGIGLATAPTPFGPWTPYGGNPIYLDPNTTAAHAETETPTVVWNYRTSLFHMYYQNIGVPGAIGSQSTCLATSPNGITWTRIGLVLDTVSLTGVPGGGHTGYARVSCLGNMWQAYSLLGGAGTQWWALWWSEDGINWQMDTRPLGPNTDLTGDVNKAISWHQSNVLVWGNQLWWVGLISNYTGGVGPPDPTNVKQIGIAPLSPNFRRLLAKPEIITTNTQSWESTDIRSVYAFIDANYLYIYYKSGGKFGVQYAAIG